MRWLLRVERLLALTSWRLEQDYRRAAEWVSLQLGAGAVPPGRERQTAAERGESAAGSVKPVQEQGVRRNRLREVGGRRDLQAASSLQSVKRLIEPADPILIGLQSAGILQFRENLTAT